MRFACAVAVAIASLLFYFEAPAFAQATIDVVNSQSLPRVDKDGNTVDKRSLTLNPEAVNYDDCVQGQQIRFTLLMTGFEANASVQVWASNGGADCAQQLNRASANQLCWQVSGNVPLQQQVDVIIPVRKIMSGAPPNTAIKPDESVAVCGKVDLTNLSVQFLYFSPGNTATAASKKEIPITVDTVGPSPPTGIRVLPGNTRIQVTWDNISGEGGVSALTGVRVYCDPAQATASTTVQLDASCTDVPNEASVPDASDPDATVEDAGFTTVCTDGGTQTIPGSTCSSPNFVNPDGTKIVPDNTFNGKYECGEITGNSGTTVNADGIGGKPLTNGTTYAVAVAATDAYGNVGTLSDTICEKPEETNDFWDAYRSSGGKAGGGFCAASGVGEPAGSFAVFGVIVAASISLMRRRKDRR